MRSLATLLIVAAGLVQSLCLWGVGARIALVRPPRSVIVRTRAEVAVVAARELDVEPTTRAVAEPVPKPAVAPRPVAAAKPEPQTPDFRAALARAAESLPICQRATGPEGRGSAEVTFHANGDVDVRLAPPFAHTAVGACVARRFASAGRAFDGEPVTIPVRFEL